MTTARHLGTRTIDGDEAHVLSITETYDGEVEEIWDAVTDPERIPRWFLPVSGDLTVGGRYKLEGNAEGEVLSCEPPRAFGVTWEYGGDVSFLYLDLAGHDGATDLRLRHAATVNDHWDTYGPGAVGVGWDLTLLGLAAYLPGGAAVPKGMPPPEVMRRSAQGWGAAHAASGVPAAAAEEAAARTSAFYAP